MPFPYIFTFYSYKGGVGRSMAVMNVAYTLAGRGRHVLVVDMDLEAPGISGFLQRSKELAEPDAAHPKDVLTLLGEATRSLGADGVTEAIAQSIPPVSNYARAVAEKNLESLKPKLGTLGRLDILGTDLDRDYMSRLAELGLKDLSQDRLIALSSLLHFYFKAQVFPHRPLGVESFEPAIETHYDYVLVDSRTGITEIGGLCVGPLADRLVVITGLNDQNVQGTLSFMEEAGIRPRVSGDQPWDEADAVRTDSTGTPGLGPKPTILVASPVPDGEIGHKRQRLGELEKCLGIRPISLSYHPQMALMESVFVRDYREESLAREYEDLTTNVMAQVGDDPQRLASEAWSLSAAAVPEMRQLYAVLSQNIRTRLVSLNKLGLILSDEADTKAGEEAERLLEEAGRKFADALQLKPDSHEALSNWGIALSKRARIKTGEEAERFFGEAAQKFAGALRLKPDFHQALSSWGAMLSDQAKTKTGDEASLLLEEACRKFAEAVQARPSFFEALNNWGGVLTHRAKILTGKESDRQFEEAGRKFAEALRLKPAYAEALSNWGSALVSQASMSSGETAQYLLQQAREKLVLAEGIRVGSAAYNLANASAIEQDGREAVRWLKAAESAGTRLSKAKIHVDKDFDRIRDQPEFMAYIESLPEK